MVRHLAGLIAFVFAFVSFAASQHHHTQEDRTAAQTSAARFLVPATDSGYPVAPSLANSDCASCDWLATEMDTPGLVTATVTVTFSVIAALLLQVRCAALCAAPKPRQGLRAPPLSFA